MNSASEVYKFIGGQSPEDFASTTKDEKEIKNFNDEYKKTLEDIDVQFFKYQTGDVSKNKEVNEYLNKIGGSILSKKLKRGYVKMVHGGSFTIDTLHTTDKLQIPSDISKIDCPSDITDEECLQKKRMCTFLDDMYKDEKFIKRLKNHITYQTIVKKYNRIRNKNSEEKITATEKKIVENYDNNWTQTDIQNVQKCINENINRQQLIKNLIIILAKDILTTLIRNCTSIFERDAEFSGKTQKEYLDNILIYDGELYFEPTVGGNGDNDKDTKSKNKTILSASKSGASKVLGILSNSVGKVVGTTISSITTLALTNPRQVRIMLFVANKIMYGICQKIFMSYNRMVKNYGLSFFEKDTTFLDEMNNKYGNIGLAKTAVVNVFNENASKMASNATKNGMKYLGKLAGKIPVVGGVVEAFSEFSQDMAGEAAELAVSVWAYQNDIESILAELTVTGQNTCALFVGTGVAVYKLTSYITKDTMENTKSKQQKLKPKLNFKDLSTYIENDMTSEELQLLSQIIKNKLRPRRMAIRYDNSASTGTTTGGGTTKQTYFITDNLFN